MSKASNFLRGNYSIFTTGLKIDDTFDSIHDTINIMKPPYSITDTILNLIAAISEKIGAINATHLYKPHTELRKKNRIKTI